MARRVRDGKAQELARSRTLNPRPEAVTDGAFGSSAFFDARDLVQVKYEMVRRVGTEGSSVSAAAGSFGFSRQSYYSAAQALAQDGLVGLVPIVGIVGIPVWTVIVATPLFAVPRDLWGDQGAPVYPEMLVVWGMS